ncbi:MAG: hypothetical protein FWK04_25735 [Nostoc sp. GBBB01]|nr:hypothetical protein [Nostoc sp. GBBB01]
MLVILTQKIYFLIIIVGIGSWELGVRSWELGVGSWELGVSYPLSLCLKSLPCLPCLYVVKIASTARTAVSDDGIKWISSRCP